MVWYAVMATFPHPTVLTSAQYAVSATFAASTLLSAGTPFTRLLNVRTTVQFLPAAALFYTAVLSSKYILQVGSSTLRAAAALLALAPSLAARTCAPRPTAKLRESSQRSLNLRSLSISQLKTRLRRLASLQLSLALQLCFPSSSRRRPRGVCAQLSSVETAVVFRSLTPLVTLALERATGRPPPSAATLTSLLVISGGAIGYARLESSGVRLRLWPPLAQALERRRRILCGPRGPSNPMWPSHHQQPMRAKPSCALSV